MSAFGTILRDTRKARRFSQLELAVEADVSSRHISFIESGRSRPSRDMVIRLAKVLDVPLREVNIMLHTAGFSHEYRESGLDDPALTEVQHALQHMMDSHDPYPAVVVDDQWNILLANNTQMAMTQELINRGAEFPASANMMDMLFAPGAYRRYITNWDDVACTLLQRVHKEHLLSARNDEHNELLTRLLDYPGIPADWNSKEAGHSTQPYIPMQVAVDDIELQLFSTIATFGTPLDVTLQNIRIEHIFPADEITRQFFHDLQAKVDSNHSGALQA